MRRAQVLFSVVAVLAVLPGVASAQKQTFFEIEVVGGLNFPQPDLLDDGYTAALRFGRSTSRSTAFDVTVGFLANDYVNADGDFDSDRDTWFVEVNEILTFNNKGTLRPALSLGIGYAWTDSLEMGSFAQGVDMDGLTANGALRLEIWVNRRWAIVPGAELRYFKEREDDRHVLAATVAVAYRFNRSQ